MSYYRINVSLNGRHYFATAEHSLTSERDAQAAYWDFTRRFPASEGFAIDVTYEQTVGKRVTFKPEVTFAKPDEVQAQFADLGRRAVERQREHAADLGVLSEEDAVVTPDGKRWFVKVGLPGCNTKTNNGRGWPSKYTAYASYLQHTK